MPYENPIKMQGRALGLNLGEAQATNTYKNAIIRYVIGSSNELLSCNWK